ncbi:MAG: hypothetical protein PHD81_00920 [Candidatus Nanoarchaeia archaeon]|nr:hypothetical protein [Candidatus Nanoarchaeia archaeon]MDD5587652.1 hypothetical protein [Candidatus Nanoarchaeia archaeon]
MKKKTILMIVIFLIIVSVIVASTVYYLKETKSNPTYTTYKGVKGDYKYTITNKGGIMVYDININVFRNGQTSQHVLSTRYSPEQIEDVPFDDVRDKIIKENTTMIYLSHDPDFIVDSGKYSVLAQLEINRVTGCDVLGVCLFGFPTKNAVTKERDDYTAVNIHEKNCDDATANEPVIILQFGKENRIYEQKPYCIILESKTKEELLKVADKFIMHLVGIF